jgi:hypothetical protein
VNATDRPVILTGFQDSFWLREGRHG